MPLLRHALLFPTLPSPLPTPALPKNAPLSSPHRYSTRGFPSSRGLLRCSLVSVSPDMPPTKGESRGTRPSPAEVSRTIMELSSRGTLSTLTPDGWPIGIGARFVVDARGAPALCLNQPDSLIAIGGRSSFHVQFEQSRSRTPQCTLLGSLSKPDDELLLKTGVWMTSSEYINADPDPIRNFAEKIVDEMNLQHAEDVRRLCNVYVDSGFEVTDAKMIWVDRLGFDLYICSGEGVFAARIPFPREVEDEKGVKSSFN
uniref:Glutamyl-tRNA reductase-binding protein, chloroplastic n=1 Tax=Elaeis guineensis var. tenera TaxID=51953 RepID=A0A6I9QM23_ELAGV